MKKKSRVNFLLTSWCLSIIFLLVGCGTTWKVKSVTQQDYLVEELGVRDSEENTIKVLDGRSEINLSLEGVKRIVLNHDHYKQYQGKSWVLVRVDFEEGESLNAAKDSNFIVGDREIYMQNGTWIMGEMGESQGSWPLSDIQEVTLEEENFLTMDSTKQISSTLNVKKTGDSNLSETLAPSEASEAQSANQPDNQGVSTPTEETPTTETPTVETPAAEAPAE